MRAYKTLSVVALIIALLVTALTGMSIQSGQSETWESLGGTVIGSPAIASAGDFVHMLVRGLDGLLYHKWYDGSEWHPDQDNYTSIGMDGDSSPLLAISDSGQVAAMALDNGDAPFVNIWIDELWSGWDFVGGIVNGTPAMLWVEDRLIVVARGQDDQAYIKWWEADEWLPGEQDWLTLAGQFESSPVITSTPNGGLLIFMVDEDGTPFTLRYTIPTLQLPESTSEGGG
jgi:hypothetical protein